MCKSLASAKYVAGNIGPVYYFAVPRASLKGKHGQVYKTNYQQWLPYD